MPSDDASLQLQVDLAEFSALRAEIQTFINLQSVFLTLSIGVASALVPVIVGHKPAMRPWIIGAAPFPFAILAAMYADVVARIARAARYIQGTLRPRLAGQSAPENSLGWERYVHTTDPEKRLLWWTDKIRYAVFALPAIGAYSVSFFYPVRLPWCLVLAAANGVILLAAAVVVWRFEAGVKEILSSPEK